MLVGMVRLVRMRENRLGDVHDSGEWGAKYGELRQQPTFDGSLVIVRATS